VDQVLYDRIKDVCPGEMLLKKKDFKEYLIIFKNYCCDFAGPLIFDFKDFINF